MERSGVSSKTPGHKDCSAHLPKRIVQTILIIIDPPIIHNVLQFINVQKAGHNNLCVKVKTKMGIISRAGPGALTCSSILFWRAYALMVNTAGNKQNTFQEDHRCVNPEYIEILCSQSGYRKDTFSFHN